MPTIITHGFVGLISGKIFSDSEKAKFWILSAVVPMIPDADVVGFRFGIPYDSTFGHRGFSHSIIFSVIITLIVMIAAFREISFGSKKWYQYAVFFFLISLSHGILDMFTNGGLGVGLFIPMIDERYFSLFRPIEVSPISLRRFLDGSALFVLSSEIIWVWLPFFIIYLIKILVKKLKK
jgi:inner membrane protein